jgi:hypothetical protein
MKFRSSTWFAVAATASFLALLNLHCWQPGIGGRTDLVGGERPQGTELELFYGWPACYRAELLRSDDRALSSRILKSAPFIRPSDLDMRVVARYRGWLPALLDVSFALAATALVALYSGKGRWNRATRSLAIGLLLFLGAAYWFAERVEVHL